MFKQVLHLYLPTSSLSKYSKVVKLSTMEAIQNFQNLSWCKPDWCLPSINKEAHELLEQCSNIPVFQPSNDIEELIRRSTAFPIKFPIETVRLKELKKRRPLHRLQKNIGSSYPLVHERVLLLMMHFLIYKREFGSDIEKAFYKEMTVPEFIDRLLTKRAVTFVGPYDGYTLLSGETGHDFWETIGTMQQRKPLLLSNCLSYDELKISAMLYISSHTECINNGERHNNGEVSETDIEEEAVIIGVIGPRFERIERMDYEDIMVTERQNCPSRGYGEGVTPTTCLTDLRTTHVRNQMSASHMWRQMWADFYQVPSYTYNELAAYVNSDRKSDEPRYTDRFVAVDGKSIFDNEVYYKRLSIIAETVLLEAQHRAQASGRDAFLNIIGVGLGVWKISGHQNDVYILTFVERIRALLRRDALSHVTDVNFAYISTSDGIRALFRNSTDGGNKDLDLRIFLENERHPKGGIHVQIEKREPSAKLTGQHAGKLLVMIYPWDGNAHPGNEFWYGSLSGSGDPAAACSTQVCELHNAHINSAVCANNTRVATTHTHAALRALADYCRAATA